MTKRDAFRVYRVLAAIERIARREGDMKMFNILGRISWHIFECSVSEEL